MPLSEFISCVDTAWLRMDRPNNLMQIIGVLMFEGELDETRLRAGLRHTISVQPASTSGPCWRGAPTTGAMIPISISISTSSE